MGNKLQVNELSQSQYRQVVATARVAIRSFPDIFEESDVIDEKWLSSFRLAYARLLICGLAHFIFRDIETEDALQRALTPEIILDDSVHVLPNAHWHSEIIYSFCKKVILESDLSSVALIFDLTEQLNLMHELFDADLRSKTLNASSDSKNLKTVFETYLFQDIDGDQPQTVFSNFLFSPPPLLEPEFHFWNEWFVGFLEGEPLNWELQKSIASLPDKIWEAGPISVAAAIEKITRDFEPVINGPDVLEAKNFISGHPIAETIDIDPESGLFFTVPRPIQKDLLMGALLSQVADNLEDAMTGNNGLNEASRETRVLTRTLTRYANDPQRVEMDFTSVAVGLRRQIHDTRELPNSEDNLALLEAVEEGVRGIRAAHPDVAENRLILAQQTMRELPQDRIELLEDALPMLVAMSEDVMAEDFAADIPSLINDALLPLPNGAPPLPGADASTRIFNRVSHMRLMYDQFVENGSKAFDSKTFKTARLGLTVVGMLSGLVSLGWFLFGVI